MGSFIFILGWLEGVLLLAIIARFFAAIFSSKSRKIITENPKRHMFWIVIVIVLFIGLATVPDYMAQRYRFERAKPLIESVERGLRTDARFKQIGIDAKYGRFLSITGSVSSLDDQMALLDWIQSNRLHAPMPVKINVKVAANLNH